MGKTKIYRVMKYTITSAATIISAIAARDLPVKIPGRCPKISGSSKWSVDEYIGRWCNIANLPFFWMDGDNYCPWANYTKWSEKDPTNKYDIYVVNTEINYKTNVRDYSVGNAYVNPYEPGTLDVAFGPVEPSPTGKNYQVIDTDNENFSYVWDCDDICNSGVCHHEPLMWILNRNPFVDQKQQVENAMQVLAATGYDPTKVYESMIYSNQEGCVYDTTTDMPDDYHGPVTIQMDDFGN